MKSSFYILAYAFFGLLLQGTLSGQQLAKSAVEIDRTESSRTYRLPNGSYKTVISPNSALGKSLEKSKSPAMPQSIAFLESLGEVEWGSFVKHYDPTLMQWEYDYSGAIISGRMDDPFFINSNYRAYDAFDVSGIGDLDLMLEYGLELDVQDASLEMFLNFTGDNTVSVRTGDLENGFVNNFYDYPEANWGAIGTHTQITSFAGEAGIPYTLVIDDEHSAYSALVNEIVSRRSDPAAPHPDIFPVTFKASIDNVDGNYVDASLFEMTITWNYVSIPTKVSNNFGFPNAGGNLSMDDLQTPGLDFPSVPSGSTLDLNPEHGHKAKTLSQFLTYQGTSIMHHHWNLDEQEIGLGHSFTPDPYDRDEKAEFESRITAEMISTQVPLQFRDPWYVDAQGNQPNTFREASGDLSVFTNQQDPDPYYSVYSPSYVTGAGLYRPTGWTGIGATVSEDPAHAGDLQYRKVVFTSDDATVSANYSLFSSTLHATIQGTVFFLYTGTVQSTATFTIRPGTKVLFNSGAMLRVYGRLNAYGNSASHITLTRSGPSGSWYGIRFEAISNDASNVSYADISNATYGFYCYNANPTIENNTITDCTYGIRLRYSHPSISNNTIANNSSYGIHGYSTNSAIYDNTISNSNYGIYVYGSSSSPDIKTNLISGNNKGIYANGTHSSLLIRDNRIESVGTMYEGIYFYNAGEPAIYDNTIYGRFIKGIYANYYSSPKAIGPAENGYDGLNRVIQDGGDLPGNTIYAYNHSDPFLGSSGQYAARNTLYVIEEDNTAGAAASSYSHITAEEDYWGNPTPSGFSWDGTSSIDYTPWLSADPGGGSSLPKTTTGGLFADPTPDPIDTNSVESLWAWGNSRWRAMNPKAASKVYKILVRKFSSVPEAHIALVRVVSAYTQLREPGLDKYLAGLIRNPSIDGELQIAAQELLAGWFLRDGQFDPAIMMVERILARAPDTQHEYHALFNLFNIYHEDLEDDERAAEMLAVMKTSYPDYELTQIAQFDVGEEVDWSIAKGFDDPSKHLTKSGRVPEKFSLHANYPNPFNPITTISYDLPEDANVSLLIHDVLGREVIHLVDNQVSAGYQQVAWNGKDHSGNPVASGIYVYSIKTVGFAESRKMLLLK